MGTLLFMTTILLHAFIQGGMSRLGALILSISLGFFESFHSIHPAAWVLTWLQLSLLLVSDASLHILLSASLKVSGVVEHDNYTSIGGSLANFIGP